MKKKGKGGTKKSHTHRASERGRKEIEVVESFKEGGGSAERKLAAKRS